MQMFHLCRNTFDTTGTNTQYFCYLYLSLPHFVSNVDKQWQAHIRKNMNLFPDGMFHRHDAFFLFFHDANMPGYIGTTSFWRRTICS